MNTPYSCYDIFYVVTVAGDRVAESTGSSWAQSPSILQSSSIHGQECLWGMAHYGEGENRAFDQKFLAQHSPSFTWATTGKSWFPQTISWFNGKTDQVRASIVIWLESCIVF